MVYRLLNGKFNGEPIPEDKQLGALGILVLGGLDTTRAAIGNIAYRVATSPGVEDRPLHGHVLPGRQASRVDPGLADLSLVSRPEHGGLH